MVTYTAAPPAVEKLVRIIRKKYYREFRQAEIVVLMRSGGSWKHGTHETWAEMSKVTDKHRKAGVEGDYIMTLNGDRWPTLTQKQRRALVDHELQHMHLKLDTKGRRHWSMKPHDVEEFNVIVKRYGAWDSSLKKFRKVLRAAA